MRQRYCLWTTEGNISRTGKAGHASDILCRRWQSLSEVSSFQNPLLGARLLLPNRLVFCAVPVVRGNAWIGVRELGALEGREYSVGNTGMRPTHSQPATPDGGKSKESVGHSG